MKKTGITFAAGIIVGALVFGGGTAIAARIMAKPSTNAIWVNGVEIEPEAYLIENRNYLQLQDIAAAVDFNVAWDGANNRVLIDTTRGYGSQETVAAATPTPTASAAPNLLPNGVPILSDTERREKELEVIRLVNIERTNAGLKPLTVSEDICVVARIKTDEMVALNYLAHTSPTYGTPKEMLKAFGISCKSVGEAAGRAGGTLPNNAVWEWMHSDAHKKIILNPQYTKAGVGLTSDGEGLGYWSIILTN